MIVYQGECAAWVEGLRRAASRHPGSPHERLRVWNSFPLGGGTWPGIYEKNKLFFICDKSGAGNACVNAKGGLKTFLYMCAKCVN